MNILIVEDESLISKSIHNILKKIDFVNVIEIADNFDDGYNRSSSGVFDIFLVDIDLGHKEFSGIDLCRSIRKQQPNIPVIFITVHQSISYIEKAFSLGANDYITKPFRPRELYARVKRWLVRDSSSITYDEMTYGNLSYKISLNDFFWKNVRIDVSKKSKALLLIFLRNYNRLLSANYIQEKLWGDYDSFSKSRNLRSNIQDLRMQLDMIGKECIRNVRGEGYIFSVDNPTQQG